MTNGTCSTMNCSDISSSCNLTAGVCFNYLGALVGGVVSGVIAAIILGILAALACAGGGAYAIVNTLESQEDAIIVNNPMYEGNSEGGENALFRL